MFKLSSTLSDITAEREGEWVDIAEAPGFRVKVRSVNYGPYRLALESLNQRLARQKATPEIREVEYGKLYAKHLLVGWDGAEEPYSDEAAIDLLSNLAARDLRAWVFSAALGVGTPKAEQVQAAAGN